MEVIKIGSNEAFDELVKNNEIVLVDFYAEWCGPCKMMGPVLDGFAKKTDATILKVDTDNLQELAMKYEIRSIPTLMLFKNGELFETKQGFMPEPIIEQWINSAK